VSEDNGKTWDGKIQFGIDSEGKKELLIS